MQAATLLTLKNQFDEQRADQSLERNKTYKDVTVGERYKITRNDITNYVWVHEVKRKDVLLKRSADAKDSFTENRTRFDKYYTHAPE